MECYHTLAIVLSAVMNIKAHNFCQSNAFVFEWEVPGSVILRLSECIIPSFLRSVHTALVDIEPDTIPINHK